MMEYEADYLRLPKAKSADDRRRDQCANHYIQKFEDERRLPTLEEIVDRDFLFWSCNHLCAYAGHAAGPDGISFPELSQSEIGAICRALRDEVLEGRYEPGPIRLVSIPKSSGNGYRTLKIRNVPDRLLSFATHRLCRPYWESIFEPSSFGSRTDVGAWHMLAYIERAILTNGHYWLVTADIKNAFDNVRHDDVRADHFAHMPTGSTFGKLIERLFKEGGVGIDQGAAYSPAVLNVRLHRCHDTLLEFQESSLSMFRYVDNIGYVTKGAHEGAKALKTLKGVMSDNGFAIKDDCKPVDLRKKNAEMLGISLRAKRGKVVMDLADRAWKRLEQKLSKAHHSDNPPLVARLIATGWIRSYGLAFDRADSVACKVLEALQERNLDDLLTIKEVRITCQASMDKWAGFRARKWG